MYKNGRLIFSWEDPPPLDIPGQPEMELFPERITLENRFETPDGTRTKRAVYVPDRSSFEDGGEIGGYWQYGLTYLGLSDPDGEVRVHVSLSGDWTDAIKLFRGQETAHVYGTARWDRFYEEVGKLPIDPEERCLVVDEE